MNVTVKLPDELCRQARHQAVDESKSLSAWLADLIERELRGARSVAAKRPSLLEMASLPGAPDWFVGKDLPLEDRKVDRSRGFTFESEG